MYAHREEPTKLLLQIRGSLVRRRRELSFELVQTEIPTFDAVYRRVLPRMGSRAYRLCGGDRALADECIQQTLVEAASDASWPVLRRLSPGQQQKWVNTTMSRKIIDELRKRARDAALPMEVLPEISFDRIQQALGDPALTPDALDGSQAYRAALQALTASLATSHKGPYSVLLMDLADYTDHEIAEVMNLKPATVRAHRHRGHKIMRQQYGSLRAAWRDSLPR
jgi:DNA-directed RNA polymerase specialized sigma24 family protein